MGGIDDDGFNDVIKKIFAQREATKKKAGQNIVPNSGMHEAVEHVKRQQEAHAKKLEGLPVRYGEFAANELSRLFEIGKRIMRMSSLDGIVQYLDSLNVWQCKFSTEGGGTHRERDSLYYVTKSRISLRLKRSELEKGLNAVMQPFMETIVFDAGHGGGFYPSEDPSIDAVPLERCSQEFYDLQSQDTTSRNFTSQIPKFYKDGKLFYVGSPEHLFHDHNGSSINQIYFAR